MHFFIKPGLTGLCFSCWFYLIRIRTQDPICDGTGVATKRFFLFKRTEHKKSHHPLGTMAFPLITQGFAVVSCNPEREIRRSERYLTQSGR